MSQKTPVCVSFPTEQLARLDDVAGQLDRNRSWLVSKAVDEFLSRGRTSHFADPVDPRRKEATCPAFGRPEEAAGSGNSPLSGAGGTYFQHPIDRAAVQSKIESAERQRAAYLRGGKR